MQKIIQTDNTIREIKKILNDLNIIKYFLVCGNSIKKHDIYSYFVNDLRLVGIFNEFTPNPKYEDICLGVERYKGSGCNCIICVGGGSSIDVAKCIKMFSRIDNPDNYLKKCNIVSDDILIAIPTTAGSGSESTKFAAIYINNEKKSIENNYALPEFVILNSSYLTMLPRKQKVCSMLDALCQSIEAWWSVNSTEESIEYSKEAISLIIDNMDSYLLNNDNRSSDKILLAANLSGRAINIAKTTAVHAMSYKLTTLYNIPHGCAVAMLLPKIWEYMINNLDRCTDRRGVEYLNNVFSDISICYGINNPKEAIIKFNNILKELEIEYPIISESDLIQLTESVNMERLKNNPVEIPRDVIMGIYASS